VEDMEITRVKITDKYSSQDNLSFLGGVSGKNPLWLFGNKDIIKLNIFYNWLLDHIASLEVGVEYEFHGLLFFVLKNPAKSLVIPEDIAEDFNIHYRITGGETAKPYSHNDTVLHLVSTDEFLSNKKRGATSGSRVI
jgi:hypothetical protein